MCFLYIADSTDDDDENYHTLVSVPFQTILPSSSTSRTRHNRPSNSGQKYVFLTLIMNYY